MRKFTNAMWVLTVMLILTDVLLGYAAKRSS